MQFTVTFVVLFYFLLLVDFVLSKKVIFPEKTGVFVHFWGSSGIRDDKDVTGDVAWFLHKFGHWSLDRF
jgi:hypothetical protein